MTPEAGIYTAIVAGFLISLLGGCKGVQIGGPAGAFIVIVYGIIAQFGVGGLFSGNFYLRHLPCIYYGAAEDRKFYSLHSVSIVIGFYQRYCGSYRLITGQGFFSAA